MLFRSGQMVVKIQRIYFFKVRLKHKDTDGSIILCDFCSSAQEFARQHFTSDIRLPSDSTSRWTLLSSANASYCRAHQQKTDHRPVSFVTGRWPVLLFFDFFQRRHGGDGTVAAGGRRSHSFGSDFSCFMFFCRYGLVAST